MTTATMETTVHDDAARGEPHALADRTPTWTLLVLGVAGTLLTGTRWGIAALAWIAPVPLLLYARRAATWRAWLVLAGALALAWPVQLLQIVTPPVPALAVVGFGLPRAIFVGIALAIAELVRRRTGETVGIFAFASATAVLDCIGYRLTPLGTWSSSAVTQATALPLVQVLAFAGLAGLGFLMAWFAGLTASVLGGPEPARRWRHILVAIGTLALVLGLGNLRLDQTHERSVLVGAVVTDVGLDHGFPDAAALAANDDALFARTRLAAARGARLVVWNEVATLVTPAGEAAFVERGRREARAARVDVVLAYGVVLSRAPLRLDNKYAFVTAEGDVVDSYTKRHPVPGEPSITGTAPVRVIDRPYAKVGGAICYDYDFPEMGLAHARLGAELVAVPSSDWRGIDPFHTFMARLRAVEGGFSVVRATRWGASGAFDAYGRVRGWMETTEANDRVMIASVPVGRVPTLYAAIGDAPVAAAGAFLLVAVGLAARRRRPARRDLPPA